MSWVQSLALELPHGTGAAEKKKKKKKNRKKKPHLNRVRMFALNMTDQVFYAQINGDFSILNRICL